MKTLSFLLRDRYGLLEKVNVKTIQNNTYIFPTTFYVKLSTTQTKAKSNR